MWLTTRAALLAAALTVLAAAAASVPAAAQQPRFVRGLSIALPRARPALGRDVRPPQPRTPPPGPRSDPQRIAAPEPERQAGLLARRRHKTLCTPRHLMKQI